MVAKANRCEYARKTSTIVSGMAREATRTLLHLRVLDDVELHKNRSAQARTMGVWTFRRDHSEHPSLTPDDRNRHLSGVRKKNSNGCSEPTVTGCS